VTWREETIGDCRLILGDCREILPTLNKAAAVVTDGPYGIAYSHSGGGRRVRGGRLPAVRHGRMIDGDDAPFDPAPWLAFSEAVFFGADHFAMFLPKGRWLVWDKKDGMASNTFSDCEFAWCSNPGAARLKRYLWNGVAQAGEKGESRHHPNQKPIEVMEWAISFVASRNILDPFMGSGTTGIAAMRLSLGFVGIEGDPKYFGIACRRIEQAYRQGDLIRDVYEKPTQLVLL
jgi:site-specific DNA-methyltransferase (adenine-specific)/modification methylase